MLDTLSRYKCIFEQDLHSKNVPSPPPAASPDTPIPSPPQGPAPEMYKHFSQPLCPPASPSTQTDPWLLPARWHGVSFVAQYSSSESSHKNKNCSESKVKRNPVFLPLWFLAVLQHHTYCWVNVQEFQTLLCPCQINWRTGSSWWTSRLFSHLKLIYLLSCSIDCLSAKINSYVLLLVSSKVFFTLSNFLYCNKL